MRATALPPVSRAQPWFKSLSWGLRPRLYSVARFAGFGFTPRRGSGSWQFTRLFRRFLDSSTKVLA
jgi:hypothetical protein